MSSVQITSDGIKKNLKRYEDDFPRALAEYIWNGFDAGASIVKINYLTNQLEGVTQVSVSDNGSGINHTTLERTFSPYLVTHQRIRNPNKNGYYKNSDDKDKIRPIFHAKNGSGRLTFFTFSTHAKWITTYKDRNAQNKSFNILVDSKSLHEFKPSEPELTTNETGTYVEFYNLGVLSYIFEDKVIPYFQSEFGWFLALNSHRNFKLFINDYELTYNENIIEFQEIELNKCYIRYIQWKEKPNTEFSHIYFFSGDIPCFKKTTSFNNKGDNFYHSVFVNGETFNSLPSDWYENRIDLGFVTNSQEYKDVIDKINEYLIEKRRPALVESAAKFVERLEKEYIFPKYNRDELGIYQHERLKQVIKEIYVFEPKIFSSLNEQQEKTIVHMIDLIINNNDREDLIAILDEIIGLKSEDRRSLAEILKTTKLSNVIQTVQFIEKRLQIIEELKELVYNKQLNAKEKELQTLIENNFWLFGEEFQLVVAEEEKFEEALRKHIYILTGVEEKGIKIDDPDKLKEMDLFIVRKKRNSHEVNNIIVELKRPFINIDLNHQTQVEKYMRVILDEPRFKGRTWDFYLIGNQIDAYLDTKRNKDSIILEIKNYRLYIKTWREVFDDFEIRYNFLLERLKFERESLIRQAPNKSDMIKQYDSERFMPMHPDDKMGF